MTIALEAIWRGYFGPVISPARLKEALDGDWVVFDKTGQVLDTGPTGVGLARLVVSPVTDALKEVDDDGRVTGSVAKDRVWAVEAIVLNRVILEKMGEADMSLDELLEKVPDLGFGWQISPTSAL